MNIETVLANYIEAALWSSNDDNDDPMDENYDRSNLAPETVAQMTADCTKFVQENEADLITYDGAWTAEEMAGHDFWLTRNHHGAGFWDGDWEEQVGERLTKASHAFPEVTLYVGDDGLIYQE